jgi:putative restriction endonuclease
MASANEWLDRFGKLRVDRSCGDPAPHKPLLLLVILDLAERGQLPESILELTPELAFQFRTYGAVVVERRPHKLDVCLPFHHLANDGLWTAIDKDRKRSAHYRTSKYAVMDSSLVSCLRDSSFRSYARMKLISHYFQPQEQIALCEILGIPFQRDDQGFQGGLSDVPDAMECERAIQRGREARFRLRVVTAYNYTCALTGYRLTTISAGSIVDAAHIHPFAVSRNNDQTNGIALCKNAHWQFDEGLWSIADDYRIIVATGHFSEAGVDNRLLASYHGNSLHLPIDKALWPKASHLSWHRTEVFLSSSYTESAL